MKNQFPWKEIALAMFVLMLAILPGFGVVDGHVNAQTEGRKPTLEQVEARRIQVDNMQLRAQVKALQEQLQAMQSQSHGVLNSGPQTNEQLQYENESLRQLVNQLSQQVATLKQMVSELQAKVPPVVEKPVTNNYKSLFDKAKADARQACKDAGGKLWVMVQAPGTPQQTLAVSCELR